MPLRHGRKLYYDPVLGRFLTRDPAGYPDGPNNYLYCNNNPVNEIDPLGLFIGYLMKWQAGKTREVADRVTDSLQNSRIPGAGALAMAAGAAAEFGAAVGERAANLDPTVSLPGMAQTFGENYSLARDTGSGVAGALGYSAMMANPTLGMAEAAEGKSYQPADIRSGERDLSGMERFERGANSVAGTAMVTAVATAGINALTGGKVTGTAPKPTTESNNPATGTKAAAEKGAGEGVKTTQVTSWADKGITPDLKSGRWVMKGGPTKANFWKSGLPGPKVYWSKKFPFLKFKKSKADFTNFITDKVPASSVNLPPGPEVIKAPLGQRILGGDN